MSEIGSAVLNATVNKHDTAAVKFPYQLDIIARRRIGE